jgi:pimeloyl-ACP methyl ester carboxylesterase
VCGGSGGCPGHHLLGKTDIKALSDFDEAYDPKHRYSMDSSKYKQLATTTGQNYNYYFSAAEGPKLTVLFVHGFPSTSYDWRHQVTYFQTRGYGVIVPDQLGYGGTSKPTDTESYRATKMAKSIVDILDAEGMEKVVAIGHDWCVPRIHHDMRYVAEVDCTHL